MLLSITIAKNLTSRRQYALELLSRHAGMAGHDQFHEPVLARSSEAFHVAFQRRLERLLGLPFRMLRGQRLDPVDRKQQRK